MDRTTQEALIGRILTDKTFRDSLFSDPERTLVNNGYPVLDELVSTLKGADAKTVESMAAAFEKTSLSGGST